MSEEKAKIVMFHAMHDKPDAEELAWAFPNVHCGMRPLGGRIIVQLKRIRKKIGRIVIVEETKEAEKWNNMIGKVVAVGVLAFKNRDTMESWPEGAWAKIDDFVRVPKWGGDRWEINDPNDKEGTDPVLFMALSDHEIISLITANPLSFKASI